MNRADEFGSRAALQSGGNRKTEWEVRATSDAPSLSVEAALTGYLVTPLPTKAAAIMRKRWVGYRMRTLRPLAGDRRSNVQA